MTPKIRLSSDVVGSEQVCLTRQRSVPMFIEIIGNIYGSLAGFLTMGLWLFKVIPVEVVKTTDMSLTQNNRSHSTFTYRNTGNSGVPNSKQI